MHTKMTYKVFMVFMVVAMLNGTIGCDLGNLDSQKNTDSETSAHILANSITSEVLLEETETKAQVLESCLANQDVAWGHAWLESQGYTYVDTNSLVLIEMEYLIDPPINDGEDTQPLLSKQFPEPGHAPILIRADTVVWQSFENPTHDSANHTAILTGWSNNGTPRSIFIELDISQIPLVIIREGEIISGEFVPSDMGMEVWWKCMVGGLIAGGVGCIYFNGGWGHCMAGAAAITTTGCTVGAILDLFQ